MTNLEKHVMEKYESAYLIDGGNNNQRSKDDYIEKAEKDTIVAFRLNFKSKSNDVPLTKVISGMVVENKNGDGELIVETRNGLKYGVPYAAVVWVKTGDRWPKGVYEEMKQGAVIVEKGYENDSLDITHDKIWDEETLEDSEGKDE